MRNLFGNVSEKDGRFHVVLCNDAPEHLRVMYLLHNCMHGAKVNDYVELAYTSTATRGYWSVVRVLDHA